MNHKFENTEIKNKIQKRSLLISSCSKSKRKLANGPASEIYDGPVYKILRKDPKANIDKVILSAEYGLIDHNQVISPYDTKMTPKIANEIREDSTEKLLRILTKNNYSEIFVELGKVYQNAIDFTKLQSMDFNFKFDSGTIGNRLHNLKEWLKSVDHQSSETIGENYIS